MDSLFGEGSLIVRFVVAFVIVLALLGATFWAIRRFGSARVGAGAQRGRQPRLAVIDAAPVDGRRRLVLVRRDNVEHLLMIGGPSDLVVEQNIVRAVPVTPPRDVPVPRAPSISEGGSPRALSDRAPPPDEEAWTPPESAPAPRQTFPRSEATARTPRPPEPRPEARPESRPEPRAFEPSLRAPLPAGLTPRPVEQRPVETRPAEPSPMPEQAAAEAGAPDAALANMAQRLEAALRRPGAPEPRTTTPPVSAPDLAPAGPVTSGDAAAPPSAAKSKSVLDSLEEEMASLLGRPPEKQ